MRVVMASTFLPLLALGMAAHGEMGESSLDTESFNGLSLFSSMFGTHVTEELEAFRNIYKRTIDIKRRKSNGAQKGPGRGKNIFIPTVGRIQYAVIAHILQHEDPTITVNRRASHARVTECCLLKRVLDTLDEGELERHISAPDSALDSKAKSMIRKNLGNRLDVLRAKLSGHIESWRGQAPREFMSVFHPETSAIDILAYLALRSGGSEAMLIEQYKMLLEAVCYVLGNGNYNPRMRKTVLTFIVSLIDRRYFMNNLGSELSKITLKSIISRNGPALIELLMSDDNREVLASRILDYIDEAGTGQMSPYFVRNFYVSLKHYELITERREAQFVSLFLETSPASRRLLFTDNLLLNSLSPVFLQYAVCWFVDRPRIMPGTAELLQLLSTENYRQVRDSLARDPSLEGYYKKLPPRGGSSIPAVSVESPGLGTSA
ncbi:hypothetical protein PAPHI01_0027 [Pancytospora philotis]|nr:hypothetical protein PAPHI01_0027 [Pancytospora philotis]